MTDRPIIFSSPMVRALLDGRKTRRRVYATKDEDRNAPSHLARRLANGLDSAEDGRCWEWARHRNNHGYGRLTVDGRGYYAHRLAYELSKGPVPPGLDVMHDCDNPACINPDHLIVGPRSKNMADCHARGRSRIPAPRMRGESNGAAKLTAGKVAQVRTMLDEGRTQAAIARHFGISQSNVSKIKRGASWS